jgi:hypothetical protein
VKYLWISSLQTKNNQLVSLYVPLPLFAGGKCLLGVGQLNRNANEQERASGF